MPMLDDFTRNSDREDHLITRINDECILTKTSTPIMDNSINPGGYQSKEPDESNDLQSTAAIRRLKSIPFIKAESDDAAIRNNQPNLEDTPDRVPMEDISPTGPTRSVTSFKSFITHSDAERRIHLLSNLAGLELKTQDIARITRLWKLLSNRCTALIIISVRQVSNWHCVNLIKTFVNLSQFERTTPMPSGSIIKQLGLDLLHRILTTDKERLYKDATLYARNGGIEFPRNLNATNMLYATHQYKLHLIISDQSYAMEQPIDKTDKDMHTISDFSERIYLIIKEHETGTELIKKDYLEGITTQHISKSLHNVTNRTFMELNLYGNVILEIATATELNKTAGRPLQTQDAAYQQWPKTNRLPPVSTSLLSTADAESKQSTRKSQTSYITNPMFGYTPPLRFHQKSQDQTMTPAAKSLRSFAPNSATSAPFVGSLIQQKPITKTSSRHTRNRHESKPIMDGPKTRITHNKDDNHHSFD